MLLELNEVSKSFGGVAALTGVSFGVKQGEVFGVIGPNGAGKTTLFNLITGVFPASSGEIVFDGMSVVGIKPHRTVEMGIARTFQNIRLFGNMTALETVLTGMHCRTGSGFLSSFLKTKRQRIEEERCRGIAYEFLKLVGLEEDAEEVATSLPYGKQRRLEIARALATHPQLILLDEPAAGMNDSETEVLRQLIGKIRDLGITVVVIEHAMELMMNICDRMVVLNFGKKIAEGTPQEIQNRCNMLKLENIVAGYGHITALKDVSLEVPQGSVVSLIGANGAGKTTTMKTIMGLVKPTSGRVIFEGQDITGRQTHQIVHAGISLVPEGRQILQDMSVYENLEMGAYIRKDKEIEEDIKKVFKRFPILDERSYQLGGTLSGGQQQMLAIGRALMARPKLLLLDEPSMGLAPLVVNEIFETIKEISAEGTTVLLVEQNVRQALKIADYAYVLETGKMVLSGPADEVRHNPRVMEAYLGGRVE